MNLKDFRSVSVVLPMHFQGEHGPSMVPVLVEVDRDGQAVITVRGQKYANSFIEMILSQQLTGFTMNQQPAQKGIPGDNVEVEMDPPSDGPCPEHKPVQHRDGMEPWCALCSLNRFYDPPRAILFGGRPPQMQESLQRFEDRESYNEGP